MSNLELERNMKEMFCDYKKAQKIVSGIASSIPTNNISDITVRYNKFATVKYSEIMRVYGDKSHRGKSLSVKRGIKFKENKELHTINIEFGDIMDVIEAFYVSRRFHPVEISYEELSDWLDNLSNVLICKRRTVTGNGRFYIMMSDEIPSDTRINSRIDEPLGILIDEHLYDVFGYIPMQSFIEKMKLIQIKYVPVFSYDLSDISAWDLFKYIFMGFAIARLDNCYDRRNASLRDYVKSISKVQYANHIDSISHNRLMRPVEVPFGIFDIYYSRDNSTTLVVEEEKIPLYDRSYKQLEGGGYYVVVGYYKWNY